MDKTRLYLFPFLILVSISLPAYSADYPDSLILRELLIDKNFRELGRKISEYEALYVQNIKNETAFELAFRAFLNPDPSYEEIIESWIEQEPDSYIPLLVRAYNYRAMGWHIRGGSLESRRSPYDVKDVRHYHRLALNDIDKAISMRPDITILYANKIDVAKSLGDDKLKMEALNAGLQINPSSYEIRKSYLYSIHPHWGGTGKQISAFLADTRKYEEMNPNLVPLGGFLDYVNGHLKNDHSKYDKARALVSKAIEYGEKAWYYYERGISHFFLKEYDQSIADHTRALELYPEYVDSLLWRSWAYRKKQMYSEALADLDLAADLEPYNFEVIKSRANVLTRFDQYEEAVEDFKRAVSLDDSEAKTWASLGWNSAYKLKDYNTASEAYRHANQLSPGDPKYLYHYAVVLNSMRDCNVEAVFKKYLKICNGNNSKECSKKRVDWTNGMLEFLNNSDLCP